MTRWICTGLSLFAFSMFSMAQAAEPVFLASSYPPAGFESLNETQQSIVDIYYGNRYLTSQLVSYSPSLIELSSTADITRLIGNLSHPTLINNALSGEIGSHPEAVCPPGNNADSNLLKPAIAGVIFDESRFRVDILINRRFILTRAAEVQRYLPPSDAGFAMMQNFSGAISGSSAKGSRNDFTLSGLTLASWRENSLYGNWDYSKSNRLSINELYGQREFEGLEYNLGMLSSQGFGLNFTSDQIIAGGRITTSSNTRKDIDFTGGTPLEVFLPTRGRVEVRKDNRLIDSSFFEAGAQQMDTSVYPGGAYDIEIVVLDEQGNELSREHRFFAKQYRLPPMGEWLFFAESGRVLSLQAEKILPETSSQWINRAGVSRRLLGILSGTAAIANLGRDTLLEIGLFNLGYRYELSPAVMFGSDGSKGISVNGRSNLEFLSVSGSFKKLWRNSDADSTMNDAPKLLGRAFEQHSVSFTAPLLRGSLSYRYSFNRGEDERAVQTHSLDYRQGLFRTHDYVMDTTISLSQSGDNRIALLNFNFRYRQNKWNFNISPKAELRQFSDSRDRTERLRLSSSWDDGDLYEGDMRFDAGVETGSGDERLDTHIQYANMYGRANLNVNHVISERENITAWGGRLSTSFLTDGNVFAVGGEQQAESALVINLDGRAGDVFDVKVNGQRKGYAVAGIPSVIALSPFELYKVSLSSAGETLYSFDEREKSVTLYPGNVVTLDYEAVPLQLLFGRLVLNGEPLDSARINGGLYPGSTDDIGMFQLEARSDIQEIQIELDNGWVCLLPVPGIIDGYVMQMGTIEMETANCAPTLEGQLAVSERVEQK